MKNLVFVIQALNVGGSSILVCDLAKKFCEDPNYNVSLVVFFDVIDDKYKYIYECKNLNIIVLNKKGHFDIKFIKRLQKTIDDLKPDIISSHLTCIAYLKLFCKLDGVKVFHTVHNLPKKDLPFLYRKIIGGDVRKGNIKLIAISDLIAKMSSKEYKLGLKDIPVAYNGIVLPRIGEKKEIKYDFLCVGRFVSWKQFPNLVSCFSKLDPKKNNLKLALCGYGPDESNIISEVKRDEVEDFVDFYGPDQNVSELYQQSRVFCLFSSVEGNPIVILEAMSYGLPIISTYTGGIPDVVKNNVNGFLFDYKDLAQGIEYMRQLNSDSQLFSRMSQKSLELVKKYSIENTMSDYKTLFEGN